MSIDKIIELMINESPFFATGMILLSQDDDNLKDLKLKWLKQFEIEALKLPVNDDERDD